MRVALTVLGTEVIAFTISAGGTSQESRGDVMTYPVGFSYPTDNLPTSIDKGW